MLKYIAIVGILIVGILLFIKRDDIFSKVPESGEPIAALNSSSLPTAPPSYSSKPNCPGAYWSYFWLKWMCPSIEGATTTATTTIITSTTTKAITYKLILHYVSSSGFTSGYMGRITPANGGRYAAGTTAVLTAEPVKGFMVQWDGPCASERKTCKVLMDSDKTINVYFKQKPNWKCSLTFGYFGCEKEW